MGFTHHPGPLPFITLRRQQWANRLTVGELVEIHGEHGCSMPPIAARVSAIEPYDPTRHGGLHIPAIYAGERHLCAVHFQRPSDEWRKVGESWVFVLAP
jgi:hypothetical protein